MHARTFAVCLVLSVPRGSQSALNFFLLWLLIIGMLCLLVIHVIAGAIHQTLLYMLYSVCLCQDGWSRVGYLPTCTQHMHDPPSSCMMTPVCSTLDLWQDIQLEFRILPRQNLIRLTNPLICFDYPLCSFASIDYYDFAHF